MLFSSSVAKISRAKQTLEELKRNIASFNAGKPYILKNEREAGTGENILVYYPAAEIPSEWPVIIGEIVHQLRSALDLAVYELTVKEQGSPLKNTEFPIFEDEEIFSETKKDGQPTNRSGYYKIRGLRKKTISIIEAIQPFNIRKDDEAPILALLHDMDIVDKHRTLHVCRRLALSTRLELIRDAVGFISFGIELGADLDQIAVIGRLKLKHPDDNEYLTADVVIEIAFDPKTYWEFKKPEEVIKILSILETGVTKILGLLEQSLTED